MGYLDDLEVHIDRRVTQKSRRVALAHEGSMSETILRIRETQDHAMAGRQHRNAGEGMNCGGSWAI